MSTTLLVCDDFWNWAILGRYAISKLSATDSNNINNNTKSKIIYNIAISNSINTINSNTNSNSKNNIIYNTTKSNSINLGDSSLQIIY